MTERKPQGMSFRSWIDQQVADAEQRGVFDGLPGAGKPLELRDQDPGEFTDRWLRDWVHRSGVSSEEALPVPLRLRKESERLAEQAPAMRTEAEVRAAVADLNSRIMDWRRLPVGPPLYVRLADEEQIVSSWRDAQAARQAASRAAETRRSSAEGRPERGPRRWLSRFRRRHRN
jgi:hypothetical protein